MFLDLAFKRMDRRGTSASDRFWKRIPCNSESILADVKKYGKACLK